MAFVLPSYLLESVRVGQSNSPYTQSPDTVISDQAAFDAAYPADESKPRTDYMVTVMTEGPLISARFGWTRNEVIDRFRYGPGPQSFELLPGSSAQVVGTLSSDANTTRLKVRAPAASPIFDAPYRLAVGQGVGHELAITTVADDNSFGTPLAGVVEISLASGSLNWSAADLASYAGEPVLFQQQQFFDPKDSTGRLGFAPVTPADPALMLNPIPGSGQYPQLRFGYGLRLNSDEVASAAAFSVPPRGTVQWAADTGLLCFNPDEVAAYAGTAVYYDGVLLGTALGLPTQALGNISSNHSLSILSPSGADLIFWLPSGYQFPSIDFRAQSSFDSGQVGVVQIDSDSGAVRFSDADVRKYAGQSVNVTYGDLPLERGISIRFFRTPVNLDGSLSTPTDVTSIYNVTGAVWADPIIASPQISLPSIPIDSVDYPLRLEITQGKGSFTTSDLNRLDGIAPPQGIGYYIDFDAGALYFAERKQVFVDISRSTTHVALPDALVLTDNIELDIGSDASGSFVPSEQLVLGDTALLDSKTGVLTFTRTNKVESAGTGILTGAALVDLAANFVTEGVAPGAVLQITDTPAKGIYTILSCTETSLELDVAAPESPSQAPYVVRQGREILVDRFFREVDLTNSLFLLYRIRSLGRAANNMAVDSLYAARSRIRFGPASEGIFAPVVYLPTDQSFSPPPPGSVQISEATGNLNFSQQDIGRDVYWVLQLLPSEYNIAPALGLIQFSDRMLESEEAFIVYSSGGTHYTEYASFLVRKELTQPHPEPTSVLSFNTAKHPVAAFPPPAVFRGGRPQIIGTQCTVDPVACTITFLPDDQLTNALPHGATVAPDERVYIDYYVSQANGGERTFTVQNVPVEVSMYDISDSSSDDNEDGYPDNTRFIVPGDHTAEFLANSLLRIASNQIVLMSGSTYDSEMDETTVTLAPGQTFENTWSSPKLYVSSGPTPIDVGSYFVPEIQNPAPIARGSNSVTLIGDRTANYRVGTVVFLYANRTTGLVQEFISVIGATYDAKTNRTKVILAESTTAQYTSISYSIRPIGEDGPLESVTSRVPVLTQPYIVIRRIAGQVGRVLSAVEYSLENSGRLTLRDPLLPLEEVSICYTGFNLVSSGLTLQASYTCMLGPSESNGLLGQTLVANYSVQSPDTFYFRVETMTNFRGEYAKELTSAASSGASGPRTSNTAQTKLYERGQKSLYFDERHYANQDIIARATLLLYHDTITMLESVLRGMDGRVIGNNSGPFLFDAGPGAMHQPSDATNQIDDLIQISKAPYVITGPPFAVTSVGTFQKYYLPGSYSRFYPTQRNFSGVAIVPSGAAAGDEVLDTGSKKVTLVSNLHTRFPWAVVTADSSGSALTVDNATGSPDSLRPAFKVGMKCLIMHRDGTAFTSSDTTVVVTVTSVAQTVLGVSGLSGTVEAGCTVYRSPSDDSTQSDPTDALTYYVLGRDYGLDSDGGLLTFIPNRDPPSVTVKTNTPLVNGQALSGKLTRANTLTAPFKFPALYGGLTDDDGEMSFPIQGPDPVSEQGGYLQTELQLIQVGGTIRTATTAPVVSSGRLLNVTMLADSSGSFPDPQPQAYDLVRILTGVNASSDFRRVIAVASGHVTVDVPFKWDPGTFTYEITACADQRGTVAASSTTTQLNDTTAAFTTTAQPGYTLIFASGERRQITKVLSDTSVTFTPALPSIPAVASSYRVNNSLATYGNGTTDYMTQLANCLSQQAALYTSLMAQIDTAVASYGLSPSSIAALVNMRDEFETLLTGLQPLQSLVTTAVPVDRSPADTSSFARATLVSDLDARVAQLQTRLSNIANDTGTIEDILAKTDQLYDSRYVWIAARIDLQDGLVVKQANAVANRIKALADNAKHLKKLASLGSTGA